jgi:hypothetical protein
MGAYNLRVACPGLTPLNHGRSGFENYLMHNDIGLDGRYAVANQESNDPMIGDIVATLGAARYYLILLLLLGALAGGVLSLILTPRYQASMTLIPAQAGLSANAQDFIAAASPTLATLVGSRNSRSGDADFNVFIESMTSLKTAEVLQADHNVLQIFFRGRWDTQHQTWRHPTGLVYNIKQFIYGKFGRPASRDPSVKDVAAILKKRVKISLDRISGFQNVTFIDRDPQFAQDFLNWLFTAADKVNRTRVLESSRGEAAALDGLLVDTTVLDERQALVHRLVNDELSAKLSETGQPIAASRIESAWVAPDRVFPNTFLFVAGGAAGFFVLGVLIAAVIGARRGFSGTVRS